ncbi:MAG: nucleoside hydrolase [Planctomycetes bacterium]|nr:nucleoside hydrolase [Planctomycetota bacterium]
MARKVIIDCDPGIDCAVALCMAVFEPELEVTAVTAVEGVVSADRASRNVQAIIEHLDPPRYPRIGAATPLETAPAVEYRHQYGDDGMGNVGLRVAELHHRRPSDKIICDEVRAAPEEVTLITLGPLTNVAHAFQRDPDLAGIVNRIIIMGGSVGGIGNVTAAAEFNMFYDPLSAQQVFRSPTTKTLIPLDVTRKVAITLSLVDQLPEETTAAGSLLHKVITFAFRYFHQKHGQESIFLHDVVALTAAVHPELFEMVEMAGDVETRGELTTGATVFDRRSNHVERANTEVAVNVDAAAVRDYIVRALRRAGDCTR